MSEYAASGNPDSCGTQQDLVLFSDSRFVLTLDTKTTEARHLSPLLAQRMQYLADLVASKKVGRVMAVSRSHCEHI